MIAISVNIIYFFIYSFLGWVQEILYFLVTERRFRLGQIRKGNGCLTVRNRDGLGFPDMTQGVGGA